MPSATCKTCGRVTNSACSDYWDERPGKPRGEVASCLAAWVDGRWVEGCGYAAAPELEKRIVANLLKNEPKAEIAYEEGEDDQEE